MFALQRQDKIKELLIENGKMNVQELSKMLEVSDVTIRKDLDKLRKEGFLIKTHGWVMLAEETDAPEPAVELESDNLAQKQRIAEKAYSLIEKGDSIYLGSGVTCYLLAKMIRKEDNVHVVTNNVSAAEYLMRHAGNVLLIGGEMFTQSNLIFTSSERVEEYFKNVFVNKAFTSAQAIDLEYGITVTKELSTFIFKEIPSIAKSWYLMAESQKFDKVAMYQVAQLEGPDAFITDSLSEKFEKALKELEVDVVLSK